MAAIGRISTTIWLVEDAESMYNGINVCRLYSSYSHARRQMRLLFRLADLKPRSRSRTYTSAYRRAGSWVYDKDHTVSRTRGS